MGETPCLVLAFLVGILGAVNGLLFADPALAATLGHMDLWLRLLLGYPLGCMLGILEIVAVIKACKLLKRFGKN